jgi:hypothetical protein
VNDAVLGWPGRWRSFYENNEGEATVKITDVGPVPGAP